LFEWRTGNPADAVIEMAERTDSDLIVVSFRGNIEADTARSSERSWLVR
jgi:nucleotide-binding universal stress UspA family protein